MSNILNFPKGFLWGSAVAAYQVEGGIENCDWSREFPAGRACDYYNRYEKYFDMARDLGQNIHRFSLEWSRIEPEEGKFDQEAIGHYRKILLALKARNMKSMVTIWHWTNPVWFAKKGGWENSKAPEYFVRFVKFAVSELDGNVDFWITLNEPMVHVSEVYIRGTHPPHKKNLLSVIKVFLNFMNAHKKTYALIHGFNSKAKVGIAYNSAHINPANKNSVMENIGSWCWRYIRNRMFLDFIKNHLDFYGLNYYFRDTIRFNLFRFPFLKIDKMSDNGSDMGWEIFPEGIYHLLKSEFARYDLPIYITENGIADAADAKRAKFIVDHLYWIHKAISEGVDARGYLYWALMDNFEWIYGFSQKFGLIEMDFNTLETKIRPSAMEYARVCKGNSLIV